MKSACVSTSQRIFPATGALWLFRIAAALSHGATSCHLVPRRASLGHLAGTCELPDARLMTHRLRDAAAGVHHVVVAATGPSPYFVDDIDRIDWLRRFVRTLDRFDWTCIGFCLMTTHVHA